MPHEEISATATRADLSDLLMEYCVANNLPLMPADELAYELQHHVNWLHDFCARWEEIGY